MKGQKLDPITRLLRFLKLIIVVIIGIIIFKITQNSNGKTDGLGTWFTPLFFGLVFIPIIYFFVKSVKAK